MKNLIGYNQYIQSLERAAVGGLCFHHIEQCIYITDSTRKLLGVWNLEIGQPEKEISV